MKLLGHSGVGKSALVDSIRAGYFSSFFKRAKNTSMATAANIGSTTSLSSLTKGKFIFNL